MKSRRLIALAACAGLAAPLSLLPSANAAGPTVTVRTLHFSVTVGPTGDRHTCDVVGDLYRPSTATRAHPAPAILTTNGFGGSKDDQAPEAMAFAKRGYVVLSYSGLGFGGSGCKIYLDQPAYDGQAGKALVSFLGGSKAATDGTRVNYVVHDARAHDGRHYADDPRVGMIGGSYGGEVQFAVADVDPRLDTIAPIITWNDLAYSLAPNNTDFAHGVTSRVPGTEKFDWTGLFFGEGIVDGLEGAQVDPSRDVGCPNFDNRVCAAKASMDARGYPDATTLALARSASVESYMKHIRIPTLLVQGEADTLFDLAEAVATYHALKTQDTPVKMIWQSWGHSQSTPAPGELDLANPAQSYEGLRFIAWFDHYLKGARVSTGPGFAYFRDWVAYHGPGPDTAVYGTASGYPVGSTRTLYLSAGSRLVNSAKGVTAGSASYANAPGGVPTSYSETSGAQGSYIPDQDTPPYDAPGTYAAFASGPLTHPVVSVGIPVLRLHVSAPTVALTQSTGPAGKLLLFAKIYDVAPDGSVNLVHRLISPVRVADVTKTVTITLPGVAHRYAVGHRIEVVVAASDAAYRNAATVTPVSITTSPSAPSTLALPVLP